MQINLLDMAAALSDVELIQDVKRLAATERQTTAQLVAHLTEIDGRRLYLGEGCSSLFTYCTRVLHFSEHAAYLRIEAARAARKWPLVLDRLADGTLHLTALSLLAPHITPENLESTLAAARHRSKREVEEIVAALRPQPAVPASVRKLPAAQSAPATVAGPEFRQEPAGSFTGTTAPDDKLAHADWPRPKNEREVKPLSPERYKVQLTISRETHQMLCETQDLLRHQIPSGDLAEIIDRALTLLVAGLRKNRHAATSRPRPPHCCPKIGRHVPAAVKRAVWARDDGQCAFVGTAGRCTERGLLEYHHVIPFADGGKTDVSNLELRCRAHNQFEAERWSGPCEEDLFREVGPNYGDCLSAVGKVPRFNRSLAADSVRTESR